MSDAAAAIFNGFSAVYPDILPGKCLFHFVKSMRDLKYNDNTEKETLMRDIYALSKSYSQDHFDVSLNLFRDHYKKKYEEKGNEFIKAAVSHMEKVWLTPNNRGLHSGLLPGTVTTNNGQEKYNKTFKTDFKG